MSRDGQPHDGADAVVREELLQLLRECGKEQPLLSDDLRLDVDLGLSSLDVTTLLVRLTARLDAHAAGQMMADTEIATVGDLRRAFRPALGGSARDGLDALAASQRRAEARRAAGR
jgi:acyl carrier protein